MRFLPHCRSLNRRGETVVRKCANPNCEAAFLYLRAGRLFGFELGDSTGSPYRAEGAGIRRVEYFWLCGDCARKLTLVSEDGVAVKPRPLRRPVVSAPVGIEEARFQQRRTKTRYTG